MYTKFSLIIISTIFICTHPGFTGFHKHYERENFTPAEEDPWKNKIVMTLPPKYLKKYYQAHKNIYSSEDEVNDVVCMVDSEGKVRENPDLILMDNYVYNSKFMLGAGEQGRVFLAQHRPTRLYTAVKIMRIQKEDIENDGQFEALKNLNRLYACFSEDEPSDTSLLYLYMPLVLGRSRDFCFKEDVVHKLGVQLNDENKLTYTNWGLNVQLMQALIDEVLYCRAKGAVDPEGKAEHIIVVKGKKNIVFVDLESCNSCGPDNIKVFSHLTYFKDFLGLKPFQKMTNSVYILKDGIIAPPPVKEFFDKLEEVRTMQRKRYRLINLIKDFEKLKKGMQDYVFEK